LASAFNPMSHMVLDDFVKQFKPTYPVGYTSREAVMAYLQHSPIMQMYVPIMVFIDRKGVIQHQYLGDDPFMQNQEANVRSTIEAMLKEGAPAAKKTPAASVKK
jgi:hypothetical protein